MILLEYEAKELLADHGLPVPEHYVVRQKAEAAKMAFPLMLKAQIPKGGRGKAGGVQRANDQADYDRVINSLLDTELLGCTVSSLLAEECLDYGRELYVALVVDRAAKSLALLAHRQGGMEVEQAIGDNTENGLLRIPLTTAPDATVIAQLAAYYGLPSESEAGLAQIVSGLYETSRQEDAVLVEVNPLMVLKDGQLVCADAKVELDDAAQFRHPGRTFELPIVSSQFVVLDEAGAIASMANGAGLAMATVDAIAAAGAQPSNFFDVGGGTDVDGMVTAFGRITAMPNVQSIVVNIFGGITRCDEVAQAIIGARQSIAALPPLFVRLTGTNEAEGRRILADAGIVPLPTLAACVTAAVASQVQVGGAVQ